MFNPRACIQNQSVQVSFPTIKTSSYLLFCHFQDNTDVLSQVKMVSTITTVVSIGNPVALAVSILAYLCAYWAKERNIHIFARVFAGFGAAIGLFAVVFDVIFINNSHVGFNSIGIGFYFSGVAVFVLGTIACAGFGVNSEEYQVTEPVREQKEVEYYEPQAASGQQYVDEQGHQCDQYGRPL
jgi:hypothetical protein